jgi:hypothetical protein
MPTKITRSEQAQCAAMIRRELKLHYPHTTFRVTSKGYSMGDHVSIHWADGPSDAQVEHLANKYEEGSFDGMTDCYNYRPNADNIPRSKYVFTTREMTEETRSAVLITLNARMGWSLTYSPRTGFGNDFHTGYDWASHEVYRSWQGVSMVCPACKLPTVWADKFCAECGANLTQEDL